MWPQCRHTARNWTSKRVQSRSVITIKKFYRLNSDNVVPKVQTSKLNHNDDIRIQPPMRLAKRIAMAGVCSRREAEKLIQSEEVTVNGTIITNPATQVHPETDVVTVQSRPLRKKITPRKIWMANKLPGVRKYN